jgi:hypothetical protein
MAISSSPRVAGRWPTSLLTAGRHRLIIGIETAFFGQIHFIEPWAQNTDSMRLDSPTFTRADVPNVPIKVVSGARYEKRYSSFILQIARKNTAFTIV